MRLLEWIIVIVLFIVMLICFYSLAGAETKYNPFTDQWETVSPNSQLQYNPFDHSYNYQQPGSRLEYNAFQDNFQYAPPSTTKKVKKGGKK